MNKRPDQTAIVSLSKLPLKGDPFQFVKLSDVKTVPIEWVWKPYIPRGALSLIMGDGGYGKSWLTCSLAASLSSGQALPGQGALPPQRILMVGAEDGLSQVIKPKMELLEADMDMIHATDRGFGLDGSAMLHLVKYINDYDIAIVFFDPLVVYMGGRVDMHKANEARSILTLLSSVAKDTNTAIVAVHHVRKSVEGSLQHRVMGSADFINGVRSAVMVDISKGGQRYMAHVKSNWAANGPTLAYDFGAKGFTWKGEYDGQIQEDKPEVSTTRKGQVENWLRETLKFGERSAVEMLQLAAHENYHERTIARAKRGIVKSYNTKGVWMWALEDSEMLRLQQDDAAKEPFASTPEQLLAQIGRGPGVLSLQKPPETPVNSVLATAKAILEAKKTWPA